MNIETLKTIFKRDLNKLINELELYHSESNIWKIDKGILNSGGNLCLHLIGNLNTYIGQVYGNTGYIRKRDEEFSLKNVPRIEMIEQLNRLIDVINFSLDNIKPEMLENEYPIKVFTNRTTAEFMLIHLSTHLTYHLGQINYHRRLIDETSISIH